ERPPRPGADARTRPGGRRAGRARLPPRVGGAHLRAESRDVRVATVEPRHGPVLARADDARRVPCNQLLRALALGVRAAPRTRRLRLASGRRPAHPRRGPSGPPRGAGAGGARARWSREAPEEPSRRAAR